MKAYEILPAGMTGSAMDGGSGAKKPKPYEILPGAGTAAQGLVGWMKGSSSIARGHRCSERCGAMKIATSRTSRSSRRLMASILPP